MARANVNSEGYKPSVQVTCMYEKTAKSGQHYLQGRWGFAKVLLLKSSRTDDDGNCIWNLLLQEMPPKQDRQLKQENSSGFLSGDTGEQPRAARTKRTAKASADASDWQAPPDDCERPFNDEIPF